MKGTISDNSISPLFGLRGLQHGCPKVTTEGPPRAAEPKETLERIRPYFLQAGLTRLANITHLDKHDIPITVSVRPNSKSLAVSSGKAMTLDASLVSAAMEALELYAAEEVQIETFRSTYKALEGHTIPQELLPFRKNARFLADKEEIWCRGWDIMNRRETIVPFEWVNMNLCFDTLQASTATFRTDSNGLASGSTTLEAICSALFETIERDNVTCCQIIQDSLGHCPPRLNLDSIGSQRLKDLITRIEKVGIECFLFDCTLDTGVPVFKAYTCDREAPRQVSGGYGAHLDPQVAMERALIEALQGRTVIIAGARDDIFGHYYDQRKLDDGRQFLDWANHQKPSVDADRHGNQSMPSFEEDIEQVLGLLQNAGIKQTIVVDVTPADWPISVVRVLVPGLEGYHRFNAHGPRAQAQLDRAYQVNGHTTQEVGKSGVLHFPAGGGL